MDSVIWTTLIIAASSLVFAAIAFREIMSTRGLVRDLVERGHRFLDRLPKDVTKVFTPRFFGDVISHALTKDIQNKDGSPVTMNQYVQETFNGYVTAYGPALKAEFKAELPKIVAYALNPKLSPPDLSNPGVAMNELRWGSGGLKAATKNVSKAAKKVPFAEKVGEYVEGAQAVVALGGTLKELGAELKGTFGKGNGGDSTPSTGSDSAPTDWGPPF